MTPKDVNFLYVLIYSTAENVCKQITRYKNKGTGTKMHKFLGRYI